MGADLNTQCRTVPGLIGRGLMPSSRRPDAELEAMLRERQLVLLNTWGRAAPSRCRTFENGSVASQLDFICTWRRHADSVARTATPLALDLVPWRKGPKHLPVQASIPWIPGWQLVPKSRAKPAYSRRDLNLAISQNTPEAQHLKHQLQTTLTELAGDGGFGWGSEQEFASCLSETLSITTATRPWYGSPESGARQRASPVDSTCSTSRAGPFWLLSQGV